MHELAQAEGTRLIGCTQVTEIKNTPGVTLAGLLPREFELATVYSVGVCTPPPARISPGVSPRCSRASPRAHCAPRPGSN